MNKKINSLSSIIIRSFSIMNFITIHINDTIKYSVQYLASCTCLSADMLIYHICDILHHLPLSLMLPSLLQYPLRMVAPPSPLSSPEHHKLLQHLKSLICFTFTGPEIILQDHINQAIETIPSQNVRFIHKMFIEKVRLTSFSFSLLKWAIPETEVQFSQ